MRHWSRIGLSHCCSADILCLQLLPVDLTLDKPSALALARTIEPHLATHVPQSPAGTPSAVDATLGPCTLPNPEAP